MRQMIRILMVSIFSLLLSVSITMHAKIPQEFTHSCVALQTQLKDLVGLNIERPKRHKLANKFRATLIVQRKILQQLFESGTMSEGELFACRRRLHALYIKVNDWQKGKL